MYQNQDKSVESGASGAKVTIKNLKQGTKYQVRARAYYNLIRTDEDGKKMDPYRVYGPYSSVSTVSTLKTPGKAVITKLMPKKQSLEVQLKSQKASGITGYEVEYRVKGTAKWAKLTLRASGTTALIKNLKSKKIYQVRARAFVTSGGDTLYGAYSALKSSTAK